MDGLKTKSNSNVIVIGATNRPFDLDDAVLRRLPRRLLVDLPGEKERQGMVPLIDDFEMMRVLGKGCAGKVLLVRHKPTQDLFALKAITKRHVLAHQELQHTLTEQAVLKRMAADGTDPFVVRLWWSFHDKEYLYLVMVSVQTRGTPMTVILRPNRISIPAETWPLSSRGWAAWERTGPVSMPSKLWRV